MSVSEFLSLKSMLAARKTDTAVFLGCGPSINSITPEQWKKISTFDTWAINNWIYHPTFVPNFYHVELKSYDYPMFMEHLDKKRQAYRGCHFFCPESATVRMPEHKRLSLAEQFHMPLVHTYRIFHRDRELLREAKKGLLDPIGVKRLAANTNANYEFQKGVVTKSYDISLTALLEVMCRAGYKTIVLYGVDLKDSRYFWTGGNPMYGRVHHQTNKEHEGKDPNLPHNTHIVMGYVIDFHHRKMEPNGRRLVVGHTQTSLYPKLACVDVLDL